jgi:hypothetical protein
MHSSPLAGRTVVITGAVLDLGAARGRLHRARRPGG